MSDTSAPRAASWARGSSTTHEVGAATAAGQAGSEAATGAGLGQGPADRIQLQDYLITKGRGRHLEHLERNVVVFSQGDAASSVACVIHGRVMLSVVASSGREVVIGVATAGQFIGEACLAGQSQHTTTATTLEKSTIVCITSQDLAEMLREQPALTLDFVRALLTRAVQVETWLVDQMLHSGEERLVRLLLLLAGPEDVDGTSTLPRISQEVLARMVGTTRSRVNAFFRRLRAFGVQPARDGVRVQPARLRQWRPATRGRGRPGEAADPETLPAQSGRRDLA
jgi:CRP/FNR family cyclic AMP-dependent transcriptional regulator